MSTDPTSATASGITIQGTKVHLHTWNGGAKEAQGLVLIFHGFAAHGMYPTVKYAAELLSQSNYVVVAPDLPGHGQSDGLRGYIPSAQGLIDIGVEIANHVQKEHLEKTKSKKLFFVGSSMGGTISLAVAQKIVTTSDAAVTGVVLLAPMLMLSVSTPERYLLSCLAVLPGVGTLAVIPSNSTDSATSYRDPEKRKECDDDAFSISGKMRVGSASSCVQMAAHVQAQFTNIQIPFLVLVGDEDVVVKNEGAVQLMEQAPAKDKTMKRYPALHGLLCEPKPLVDQIQGDILQWMKEHS
ncbi:Monoglyceride lipase [Seminavis robusta]|uniref:Monoglyceride lipase n=1 Tax=Seminavis robusta TaxID=568900 RepID=A0A9N8E9C4_9STRA|nr:Monoglyceride lipase [Seminavis robusta]|eukprot:Sro834_g208750.1 Monoglyceride lipase (297) ;mRNA; r:35216-36106